MKPLEDRLKVLKAAGRLRAGQRPGLGEVALRRRDEAPDRIVVSEGGRTVTRGEMVELAARLGGALRRRGLEPGAVIAFQLPNWWEACVVSLAAALFGYRLMPILTIHRTAELDAMLSACAAQAIFVPQRFRGFDYPAMIRGLPRPPARVFTVRGDPDVSESWENLVDHAEAEPEPGRGEDARLVIFTSGATGRPKGVIHTHASLDAMVRDTARHWDTGADDILYVPSPIGHVGGSIYAFEFPWITGCRTVLEDRWDPDRAVARIESEQATFMAGATPFLSGLVEAAERANSSLPSLRRFICGGASVPPELVRRALDLFPNAVVSRAYGSTEVPLACPGIRSRADARAHADTDGEIAAELRLLTEDGDAENPGKAGEIALRAPFMFAGYLDPADEAGCFLPDGFFRMGDLGRVVDGRFIVITGRKKDIIIRKGENISPLEIENALSRHSSVRLAAVVGVADRERGEMVVAFVVLHGGGTFDLDQMARHLTSLGMARQKFPERLEIVDTLPMNAVGKIRKDMLKDIATDTPRA